MVFPDRRTLNVLSTTLLFALALAIVYYARVVFVIFAFSILFAYLIDPIVRFLQRHSLFFKNLRGPHVAEAYLGLLIVMGLLVHGLAPQLVPRCSSSSGNHRQSWKTSIPAILQLTWDGGMAGMRANPFAQKPFCSNAGRVSAVWWNP